MSGDVEQEYFADGLTEDIITALPYSRSFPVIARNSTFTYKGNPVRVQQVAQELGAHYVVEGGVRKAGNRIRITVQLIKADTGHHVWAEKYDRAVDDVFDVQDEITRRVAGVVVPTLEMAEQKRVVAKKTETLGACAVEVLMLGDWRAAAGEVGFWPECDIWPARLWDVNPRAEGRNGRDSRFIRGRWALRAPEQVRWQASTCLSTWPPSPSA